MNEITAVLTFSAPCVVTIRLHGTTRHVAEARLKDALAQWASASAQGEYPMPLAFQIDGPNTLLLLDDEPVPEPSRFDRNCAEAIPA